MSVQMTTPFYEYTYVYQSIRGVPEYVNLEFAVHWIAVFVLVTLVYTVPAVCIFARIAHFYAKNVEVIKKNGLRIEIFQAFLLMQFWSNVSLLSDFLMFRIPNTSALTSFCAVDDPQILIKLVVFMYFASSYTADIMMIMFCVMRVAILYLMPRRTRKQILYYFTIATILLSFLVSLPHLLSEGVCVQLFTPYPFGSIIFISNFHLIHVNSVSLGNLLLLTFVTCSIIILNVLMLLKIRERKELSFVTNVSYNTRAERTLTGTMIILLVPMLISQFIAIGEMFHFEFLSYILLLRPVFVDARVHIVSCFFYFTHPVFKKNMKVINRTSIVSHTLQ
ncbi:unnamed protein product [Caenorhabditis sp. 36 PRJEB53466]|nr:unnamed protein product [Caenorhabditis sp. 36 PRJEB53466]